MAQSEKIDCVRNDLLYYVFYLIKLNTDLFNIFFRIEKEAIKI